MKRRLYWLDTATTSHYLLHYYNYIFCIIIMIIIHHQFSFITLGFMYAIVRLSQ